MKKILSIFSITSVLFILTGVLAYGADFSVSPIKVFFRGAAKTSAVAIKNNSADAISLQVKVVSWSQDEKGEDHYTPTNEIIAFPKIFRIKKEEEQLIRIGLRAAPGEMEKTYRIYVSEIPEPQSKEKEGTMLRTLMRVGIPIFVEPVAGKVSGSIEKTSFKNGRLTFVTANTGNQHFIMRAVKVEGKDSSGKVVFFRELAGRYLHGGRYKKFMVDIPKKECVKINQLDIEVSTDRLSMNERVDVTPTRCSP